MKKIIFIIGITSLLSSCRNEVEQPISVTDNPLLKIEIPANFPAFNQLHSENPPTQYGVELGKKLFHDPILSGDNSVSCATCHQKQKAFADSNTKAVGIHGRVGLRNSPPIQNMAFMNLYMWDGAVLDLKEQPRIPIVNPDEMDSSVLQIIAKIKTNKDYINLFQKAFGDDLSDNKTAVNHLLRSLAQYMSTL
ncbi:MAG: cytochrome-c peroxidase, partial [Bergeyella zoohelcum]|nr:cytochrome-c peroxidase [Bergeyella zoohelcum]